jgi:hypothetical protein
MVHQDLLPTERRGFTNEFEGQVIGIVRNQQSAMNGAITGAATQSNARDTDSHPLQ